MEFYDEFGNYCGLDIPIEKTFQFVDNGEYHISDVSKDSVVILSEDKEYFKDAYSIFNHSKSSIFDEDEQDLSKSLYKSSPKLPKETENQSQNIDFLLCTMNNPSLIRNVGIFGNFHHGKTTLLDAMLYFSRDSKDAKKKKDLHNNRGVSTKSIPTSALLETTQGKTFLINFLDCPGHCNFFDEIQVNLPLIDGAIIVVDVVEGVMINTERIIKEALLSNISICLVLNKMDRLILELKLPPQDVYYKLLQIIEEVNHIINLNINQLNKTLVKRIRYFMHIIDLPSLTDLLSLLCSSFQP